MSLACIWESWLNSIPCILGMAAIAIELYPCSAAKFSYDFVYYLMPICRFLGQNQVTGRMTRCFSKYWSKKFLWKWISIYWHLSIV
jgi:hypothetical protein